MGAAFFADPRLLGGSGLQGGPLPCLEFKLREAPQLGLLSDAKDVYDRPTPGGEILVRGTSVFESYFNNEPLTRAAVDEEGWFHTSDLGVLCPQTRGLKLLGSLHEAFKLQPGEFVFPQVLESVYQSAPLVKTIFVHGSPLHDRLVAVLNLDKEQAESLARDLNLPFPDYASLLASPQFVLAVKAQLEELARSHKLKAYERIHAVHLEPQGFFSLGLLSATLKLNRSKCKAHFDEIILRLYREN